jgi:phosphoribosylformimino-5-aminoimidazole carboxamide ribotide isomerase
MRNSGALAMLIPSIDLMGGKIVQLIQGKHKALEFDDFAPWVERFSRFPLVQLIDLDAALGRGSNRALVQQLCRQLPCQVGGGVRNLQVAEQLLAEGARRLIIGSALFDASGLNTDFARELDQAVGRERLVFALDSKNGRVVTHGWKTDTDIIARDAIDALEPWCGAFLYTHVDTEGLMQGIPMDIVRNLRRATSRQLMVAGGIASMEEVENLNLMQVDAVLGMAIYTGKVVVS